MTDFAFVCPGTCRAAVVRPRCCGDQRCTRFGEPLQRVPVLYSCPKCQFTSPIPAVCPTPHGQPQQNDLLPAKAVVPPNLQTPILDPPEENRTYSSVYGANAVGTGHARSTLASAQAWSAQDNDTNQWMTVDAGCIVDSIGGLLLANRNDGHFGQIVTKMAIDVAIQENKWTPLVVAQAQETFDTNLCCHGGAAPDCAAVHFPCSVRARYVRIRPLEWENHISLRCALLLDGTAAATSRSVARDEHRTIVDVNQLPARVPVTCIPGGTAPPRRSVPHPLDVAQVPSGDCAWAGRQVQWDVRAFNGKEIVGADQRAFAVLPNQACSITVGYSARWHRNRRDYCPGCIVQLYYGMASVFCQGVIQHGIRSHRGVSTTEFSAPIAPGLYYITQSVSLMYNFIDNLPAHQNTPNNSIAVIRVLPREFSNDTFVLLPVALQRQVVALFVLQRRQERGKAEATLFSRLPREPLYHILSFLMDPNDDH